MKIESARESFLSDYEVYKFFKESKGKNNKGNPFEYNQISKDLLEYIKADKNTSANDEGDAQQVNRVCSFDDDQFKAKLLKLNQYQLFKFEKLQLLNTLPNNLVHMFSIIEECDNRFNETEINEILSILTE